MAISFPCPACGKEHTVREELCGKLLTCRCGRMVQVPAAKGAKAPTPPAGGGSLKDWIDDELSQPPPPAKTPSRQEPPDEPGPAAAETVHPGQALADRVAAKVAEKEEEFRRDRAEFASTVAFRMLVLVCAPALVLGVGILIGYCLPAWDILAALLIFTHVLLGVAFLAFGFFFIRVAVAAFFESVFQGLAFLFLPLYYIYYLASRWDETEGPEAFVGTYAVFFLIFGVDVGIVLQVAQEVGRSTIAAASTADGESISLDESDDEPQADDEDVDSEESEDNHAAQAASTSGTTMPAAGELPPEIEVALAAQLDATGVAPPWMPGGPGYDPMAPPGMPPASNHGLVVKGWTNLPAGTVLRIEVKSALPGAVSAAVSAGVGAGGNFSSEPILSPLAIGRFHVAVWADIVDQPSGVVAMIGGQGERLRGSLVRAGQQRVVQYEATIDLGGQQAAEAQLREAADALRRCNAVVRQIEGALRRIQEARPRLRTYQQREGFQSQIVSQRGEIERDLAALPDWSPKGLLLEAARSLEVGSEATASSLDARVEQLLSQAKAALEPLRALAGEPAPAPPPAAASTPPAQPEAEPEMAVDEQSEKAAEAELRLGKMLIEANPSAARRRLEELIERYPDTKAAEAARQALEELENEQGPAKE